MFLDGTLDRQRLALATHLGVAVVRGGNGKFALLNPKQRGFDRYLFAHCNLTGMLYQTPAGLHQPLSGRRHHFRDSRSKHDAHRTALGLRASPVICTTAARGTSAPPSCCGTAGEYLGQGLRVAFAAAAGRIDRFPGNAMRARVFVLAPTLCESVDNEVDSIRP